MIREKLQRLVCPVFERVYMAQTGPNEFTVVASPPAKLMEFMSMGPDLSNGGVVFYRMDETGKPLVATSPRVLDLFFGPFQGSQSPCTSVRDGACCGDDDELHS